VSQLKINYTIPVFMLHWNRPDDCLKSIDSFLSQDLDIVITVIDNASKAHNIDKLRQNLPYKNVNLICMQENKGWGGGFNSVLQSWINSNSSPYCFVSSHDTLLDEQCLERLIDFMDNNSFIGIASPDYGLHEIPRYSPIRGPHFIPITPEQKQWINSVDFAYATLSIFRKSCLEQIGSFDERYFAYGDEYEISLRCRRHGWQVAICWNAIVTNPGTTTPKPLISYLLARNTLLLAYEYGNWIQAWIRIFLMLCNTIYILTFLNNRNNVTFHAVSRIQGIRDFILSRYGSPFKYIKESGNA